MLPGHDLPVGKIEPSSFVAVWWEDGGLGRKFLCAAKQIQISNDHPHQERCNHITSDKHKHKHYNPSRLFELFGSYSNQCADDVHDCLMDWILDNYRNVQSWLRMAFEHKKTDSRSLYGKYAQHLDAWG